MPPFMGTMLSGGLHAAIHPATTAWIMPSAGELEPVAVKALENDFDKQIFMMG